MAVVFTPSRIHSTADQSTFIEFCTATVTGTYVVGGVQWFPFQVVGGRGSSPLPSSNLLAVDFYSLTGHTYISSIVGGQFMLKIFAGATELAAAAAVPDATINFTMVKRKI
jgi:hypothetical protein